MSWNTAFTSTDHPIGSDATPTEVRAATPAGPNTSTKTFENSFITAPRSVKSPSQLMKPPTVTALATQLSVVSLDRSMERMVSAQPRAASFPRASVAFETLPQMYDPSCLQVNKRFQRAQSRAKGTNRSPTRGGAADVEQVADKEHLGVRACDDTEGQQRENEKSRRAFLCYDCREESSRRETRHTAKCLN